MLRNLLSSIRRAYHFEEPKSRIYNCLSQYKPTDWYDNILFHNISSKQQLLKTPNTQLIHIVPNDSYILQPGLFLILHGTLYNDKIHNIIIPQNIQPYTHLVGIHVTV